MDENLNNEHQDIPYAVKNNLKEISKEELQKHKSSEDCWIVMNDIVYDLTKFLSDHPGGSEVILNFAGQDCTDQFEEVGHSIQSRKLAKKYEIGYLEGCKETACGCDKKPKYGRNISEKEGSSLGTTKIIIVLLISFLFAFFFLKMDFFNIKKSIT